MSAMSESLKRNLLHMRVLLWKNFLLRRQSGRNLLSTGLEILLPVLVVYILIRLQGSIPDTTTAASLHTSDALSTDYATTLRLLTYFPFSTISANSSVPNAQKIVFLTTSSSPSSSSALSSLTSAFVTAYPTLNASVITALPSSAQSVDEYVMSDSYGRDPSNPYIIAAIVVEQFGAADNGYQWRYTLRLNATRLGSSTTEATDQASISPQWQYDSSSYVLYLQRSQIFFQQWLDGYILSSYPSPSSPSLPALSPNLTAVPMPTPEYTTRAFASVTSQFLGLMLIVVFNWNCILVVKALVQDKEMRFREQLRMVGVGDAALIGSWVVTYLLMFLITASLVTALGSSTIFEGSSPVAVFVLYLTFELSVFCFCMLVASGFDKAQTAAVAASLLFLAIAIPYYAVDQTSLSQQTVACLSAPICFCQAVTALVVGEAGGQSFGVGRAVVMILLDCVLYLALAWYIDQIIPTEFGTHKPWHFLFHRSYWTRRTDSPAGPADDLRERLSINSRDLYEEPTEALSARQALRIRGLTKRFPRSGGGLASESDKIAVEDLTLEVYDGQIFGLLGVNGAGKVGSPLCLLPPRPRNCVWWDRAPLTRCLASASLFCTDHHHQHTDGQHARDVGRRRRAGLQHPPRHGQHPHPPRRLSAG